MTTQPPPNDGQIAQVLVKLGEMSVQLAIINEKVSMIPDHEARIRLLERFKWTLGGLWIAGTIAASGAGWLAGYLFRR